MKTGLSPNDIRNYEFAHQMRGYDKDEVREFLEQVAAALEDLKQENLKLSMERDSLRTQLEALKQFEDTIKSAAIDARRNADTLVANAKRDVNEILTKARGQAEEIVGSRKDEAIRLDQQITRLQMTKASYQSKLKNLIESHLELIDQVQALQAPVMPDRETPAEASSDDTQPPKQFPVSSWSSAPGIDVESHASSVPAERSARPNAASDSLGIEQQDPFGLSRPAARHTDPETDFGSDWSTSPTDPPAHSSSNGLVVEDATEVTRKKLETFSSEPEPVEPTRTEEANAAERIIAVDPAVVPTAPPPPSLDPELAAALENYQQNHGQAQELTSIQSTAAAPSVDQSMRAIPNDLDDRNSTDKIRAQVKTDEHDNTEHNLIDIDQPIGAEKTKRTPVNGGMDPDNIARELDEVAARFEEEMDRAAKR